jgi:hypothetical protein
VTILSHFAASSFGIAGRLRLQGPRESSHRGERHAARDESVRLAHALWHADIVMGLTVACSVA